MRIARLTAGAALIALLAGCSSLPDFSGAQDEEIDKQVMADVSAAKDAASDFLYKNRTAGGVTEEELAEYGFEPANTTQTLTVYPGAFPLFCVDATSRTGNAFKAGSRTELTEGFCEPGVDY
jgi:hypothetical protein